MEIFPHPSLANEDGILAIGGDLTPSRLLLAYQWGIFPWYNDSSSPILWWSPDPRLVIFPEKIKMQKSIRRHFSRPTFKVTIDTAFSDVIESCQKKRKGQAGTWITSEMKEAYIELHRLGYAHSFEVWSGPKLVGGLYGVSLGKCFFGESMFTKVTDASKVAFITMGWILGHKKFKLIDCQQETAHLMSLGAESIGRDAFLRHLRTNAFEETHIGSWTNWIKDGDLENIYRDYIA